MAVKFYWFVLSMLAVWRIAHLLSSEQGPWQIFAKLRRSLNDKAGANLLDCFYCTSVWVSLPFAYCTAADMKERVLLWPAISAAAILLQRATNCPDTTPPARYFEHQETHQDGMLR